MSIWHKASEYPNLCASIVCVTIANRVLQGCILRDDEEPCGFVFNHSGLRKEWCDIVRWAYAIDIVMEAAR